jgi:hypothetical protein
MELDGPFQEFAGGWSGMNFTEGHFSRPSSENRTKYAKTLKAKVIYRFATKKASLHLTVPVSHFVAQST